MSGVSGNSHVKIYTRGLHPDNLSLRAARSPRRQLVAAGGCGDGPGPPRPDTVKIYTRSMILFPWCVQSAADQLRK